MERERGPFTQPISPSAIAGQITEREQAVADGEATLGPAHPDTLTARGALARAYQYLGRGAEAVELHEKNLPRRERDALRFPPQARTDKARACLILRDKL